MSKVHAFLSDYQSDLAKYHQAIASWPNADTLRGMPFDFTIHDPKYEDISIIYSPNFSPNVERKKNENDSSSSFCFAVKNSYRIFFNIWRFWSVCVCCFFFKETLGVRRMCTFVGVQLE